jgi:hypothetical protein
VSVHVIPSRGSRGLRQATKGGRCGYLAPGHLAFGITRRIPAPSLTQRFHEKQAPAALLIQWRDAIFEFCRLGRPCATVPDLDQDNSIACRQAQADRWVPADSSGRLHAIGNKLGDEQFGRSDINGSRPFPEHLPHVKASAGHRSGERPKDQGAPAIRPWSCHRHRGADGVTKGAVPGLVDASHGISAVHLPCSLQPGTPTNMAPHQPLFPKIMTRSRPGCQSLRRMSVRCSCRGRVTGIAPRTDRLHGRPANERYCLRTLGRWSGRLPSLS